MKKPVLIPGGLAIDDRGLLRFVNDFDFKNIKRFYQVENFSKDTIRAFHGHLEEEKYVFVAKGSALVATVRLDNVDKPDKNTEIEKVVLSDKKPTIFYIPSGYANGFKILEDDTRLIFFSTKNLNDSEKKDDFRFPYDYWGKDVWNIENR